MTFTDAQKQLLAGPLNRAFVKPPAPGKYGEYIEGWRAIDEANRIFGFDGWTRETVEMIEENRELKGDKHFVGYRCKVRITAGDVIREGTGFGSGVSKNLGDAVESAVKEAETDAMKRALMTFGNPFGLALYDKTKANVADVNDNAPEAPREPAAREKLDGPHTSKTALRKAVNEIIGKVRLAQSNDEIDAIQRENIATIKQANNVWPILLTGDPEIAEDVGLKGAIQVRRDELSAGEDGQFAMLVASMKECDTLPKLTNWMATNEPLIQELDGAESRKFQLAYELHESGVLAVARVNAG